MYCASFAKPAFIEVSLECLKTKFDEDEGIVAQVVTNLTWTNFFSVAHYSRAIHVVSEDATRPSVVGQCDRLLRIGKQLGPIAAPTGVLFTGFRGAP